MALYRTISMSFWTDAKIVDDFTAEDRYFYLYLFTNPHTNLCGCYEISIRQMVNEVGYSSDSINNLIKRFEQIHKVIRYSPETKEIILLNWHKYNWSKSEKCQIALKKEIDQIKCPMFKQYYTDLINGIDTVSIQYPYSMDITNTITNAITVTNTISSSDRTATGITEQEEDLFEMLWSIYPKKRGKGQVSKRAKHQIAKIGYDHMARAIERYSNEVAGKDPQYTMYGSTFFNSGYVDYLDDNYKPLPTKEERDFAGILEFMNSPDEGGAFGL